MVLLLLPVLAARDAGRDEDDAADEAAHHRQDDHVEAVDGRRAFIWRTSTGSQLKGRVESDLNTRS